jgi:GR25 family glycosyltransferase involved in LPS biosynthesis
LQDKGVDAEVFAATPFNGREFAKIIYAGSHSLERPMTAGEIACSWSHYKACEKLVNLRCGGLIFEDDARLIDAPNWLGFDTEHLLSGSAYDADHQWDGFSILSSDRARATHKTLGLPYGTQGYYVSAEGARVLRDNLLPIRWASDVALDRLSKLGILKTELAMIPWAVQSGDINSYIGQR